MIVNQSLKLITDQDEIKQYGVTAYIVYTEKQ